MGYKVEDVKFVWGGAETPSYSMSHEISISNGLSKFKIKDLSNLPEDHQDYSVDLVLIESDTLSFKLYKDSLSHKVLKDLEGKEVDITLRFDG